MYTHKTKDLEATAGPRTGWIILVVVAYVVADRVYAFVGENSVSALITGGIVGYWCARRWFHAKKLLTKLN